MALSRSRRLYVCEWIKVVLNWYSRGCKTMQRWPNLRCVGVIRKMRLIRTKKNWSVLKSVKWRKMIMKKIFNFPSENSSEFSSYWFIYITLFLWIGNWYCGETSSFRVSYYLISIMNKFVFMLFIQVESILKFKRIFLTILSALLAKITSVL